MLAILVAGTAVRIAAALAPGSMWFDELHTAVNVMGRDWAGILQPLAYYQVAPLGFIAAEMASVALFGLNEVALRAIPLAASIFALFLFWRLATRFLSGTALYGAVAVFAVNPALVWYARKVKQYSSDLCVVLALLVLAARFLERPHKVRTAAVGGVLGGFAIVFSQPAAVVAAGLLLVLVSQERVRAHLLPFGIMSGLWMLGGAVQIVTSLRLAPRGTMDFMWRAWADHFPEWNGPTAFLLLGQRVFESVGFGVGLIRPDTALETAFLALFTLLALFGAFHLFRRRSVYVALLFTPLAVAIVLPIARILPLSGRIMIYVAPTFVIACFAGIARLTAGPLRGAVRLLTISLIAVQAALLLLLLPTLNAREDAELVLHAVQARWRPGDVIYVNTGAVPAMSFYGTRLKLEPWIPGGPPEPDSRANLRELDALRGRPRAWVFLTHVGECHAALVRSYLSAIGREMDAIEDPHGITGMHEASARLYDLSDPERLSRSDSRNHPLIERGDPQCRAGDNSAGRVIRDRMRGWFDRIGKFLD